MVPDIKTILYATDLGTHMRPVFRHAVGIAKKYKAKIIMLHVMEPLNATARFAIESYLPDEAAKQFERDGMERVLLTMRERLEKFCLDELGESPADCDLVDDVYVVHGAPAQSIVQEAEARNADIIIMGRHTDRHSWGGGLLGSVARKVTAASKKPVLVVPVYEE